MAKLTKDDLAKLIDRAGRHGDGQGLYFRAIGERKAYWVYRYRAAGKEREISIGPYPEVSLAEARIKHAGLRKSVVVDKRDPVAEKRAKRAASAAVDASAPKPTFGQIAAGYIETHESSWRNAIHRQQWRNTIATYCEPIAETPVDRIDAAAVLSVLKPVWTRAPETASRLRGRIEAIIDAARALGHIDADRANPARWKGHLDKLLPKRSKLSRGHHAAMAYTDLPAFMATLSATPGTAAKALAFVILTAARSGEALGMTWHEVDLETKTWTVPAARMKASKTHRVPLSAPALAILRDQLAERDKNPFVFPSHLPRQPLSNMSLLMLLRRMKVDVTAHGFRSAFRDWAGDETHFQREVMEAGG